MRKTNSGPQKRISIAAYLSLSVGFIYAMSMSLTNKNLQIDKEKATDQARELTGIKSENNMKRFFYKLRDEGLN